MSLIKRVYIQKLKGYVVGPPHRYNLVPVTQDLSFLESGGEPAEEVTGDRSQKRSPKKEDRRSMMIREQSDDEDSAGEMGNNRFVDATAETEVELRLPLEVEVESDKIREHVPIFPGPANQDVVHPRSGNAAPIVGPPNGAKPKWPRHVVVIASHPGTYVCVSHRWPEHFTGRIRGWSSASSRMSNPTYPGLTQRRID